MQALFTTGDGKPVVINNRKHLINASFHTSSPHTAIKCPPFAPLFSSAASVARPRAPAGGPGAEIGSLRKTLFADGRVASGAKVAAKRQDAFTRRARPPRGGGNAIRLATTPFKKPRQVARRGKPAQGGRNGGVATVCKGKLPGKFVPPLLKNGDIQCRASCHSKLHRCSFRKQTFPVPSFIDAVNCLEKCMTFVFDRQQLGHVACLPESIVVAFQFQQLSAFGVGNCLSWMHSIFPNVENKPASCVGSAAWTRLAYSLAVWKLAKLENLRQHRFRQYGPGFLSVANLVRELLRRISHEWHANKQPHLLRMLRKDSSPASHAVLIVAGIQLTHTENVSLLLSDGWYVANALLDSFLEQRVWNGNIKVGQKIAISGASLQSVQSVKPFFFGEGDELVTSAFRLHANGVFRLSQQPNLCMGIHRPSRNTSIANIVDNGGLCPAVQVVILRSYPLFYIESINRNDDSTDDKPIFVRRREEGEDEARMAHQEAARQKFVREREHQRSKGNEHVEDVEIERRNVNSVMDVMVCGTDDDPHDTALRKIVRIYNVGEALQCVLSKESQIVLFTQLWPKKSGWTCKPDGIRDVGNGSCNTRTSVHQLSFPRRLMSLTELRKCNTMVHGDEFDGVFSILHVTARDSNVASRFTYLADDTGEEISVLALELSEADSECLPRTLRFKPGLRPRFPLIGLRDAEFRAVSTEHDLVHAKATLRTSIISARALCRQEKRSTPLRIRHEQVESRMKGKEAQLEILREAVVSFASGNRRSIGAYFTSTQDM